MCGLAAKQRFSSHSDSDSSFGKHVLWFPSDSVMMVFETPSLRSLYVHIWTLYGPHVNVLLLLCHMPFDSRSDGGKVVCHQARPHEWVRRHPLQRADIWWIWPSTATLLCPLLLEKHTVSDAILSEVRESIFARHEQSA